LITKQSNFCIFTIYTSALGEGKIKFGRIEPEEGGIHGNEGNVEFFSVFESKKAVGSQGYGNKSRQ